MPTKSILILPGGKWQLDLIRRASQLGFRTIVADVSPNAPASKIADVFIVQDTNDREALSRIGRKYDVSLVLADQTDRLVPVAADVAAALKLPGLSPDAARRFSNKAAMRDALVGTDIPMPRYKEVRSENEAIEAADGWGYPVVLKPKEAQSSLGVRRVLSAAEISGYFKSTLSHSRDGAILVEEFVDGLEVTAEGISVDGVCCILAVSEKKHYDGNPCVARSLAYPPRLPEPVFEYLRQTAKRTVELLGQNCGLNHAEYRIRDGIPYLVEVAARGGGNAIASRIVPFISGIDTYTLWIRGLLGEHPKVPPSLGRAALLEFFSFASGKVRSIRGVREALEKQYASEIVLPFSPGENIAQWTDDRNRPGYFISFAETRDELDRKAALVHSLVQIEYDS